MKDKSEVILANAQVCLNENVRRRTLRYTDIENTVVKAEDYIGGMKLVW